MVWRRRTAALGWLLALFLASPARAEETVRRAQEVLVESETEQAAPASTVQVFEDTPVEKEVIQREQIENRPGTTAADLLRTIPGVRQQERIQGEKAAISIEGMPAEYTRGLVDGDRYSGEIGAVDDFASIPLQDAENVQVLRGAQSLRYGAEAAGRRDPHRHADTAERRPARAPGRRLRQRQLGVRRGVRRVWQSARGRLAPLRRRRDRRLRLTGRPRRFRARRGGQPVAPHRARRLRQGPAGSARRHAAHDAFRLAARRRVAAVGDHLRRLERRAALPDRPGLPLGRVRVDARRRDLHVLRRSVGERRGAPGAAAREPAVGPRVDRSPAPDRRVHPTT